MKAPATQGLRDRRQHRASWGRFCAMCLVERRSSAQFQARDDSCGDIANAACVFPALSAAPVPSSLPRSGVCNPVAVSGGETRRHSFRAASSRHATSRSLRAPGLLFRMTLVLSEGHIQPPNASSGKISRGRLQRHFVSPSIVRGYPGAVCDGAKVLIHFAKDFCR